LAIANKSRKAYTLCIITCTFRKFLFIAQGFMYQSHIAALYEIVLKIKDFSLVPEVRKDSFQFLTVLNQR